MFLRNGRVIICWKQYFSKETVNSTFQAFFNYFMRWFLFDLIPNVFSDMSGKVFLGWTSS